MTTATTTPICWARPATQGLCDCNTAPKAFVRKCSRSAAFVVFGRRYCAQHLPEMVQNGATLYTVVKK